MQVTFSKALVGATFLEAALLRLRRCRSIGAAAGKRPVVDLRTCCSGSVLTRRIGSCGPSDWALVTELSTGRDWLLFNPASHKDGSDSSCSINAGILGGKLLPLRGRCWVMLAMVLGQNH